MKVVDKEVLANQPNDLKAPASSGQPLRTPAISLITQGFAILKLHEAALASTWACLDKINRVSMEERTAFSFPQTTSGFLPQGGEHAKYTNNADLCDRFCYWQKYAAMYKAHPFANEPLFGEIAASELHMWSLAQNLIKEIWTFFHSREELMLRSNSYLQLCMYESQLHDSAREYLQDRHEDGHLLTLIKPNRDGLVLFLDDEETPIYLKDDEILAITGSLLTTLSDGQIAPMYHAVRKPNVRLTRNSIVYFAIPDLSRPYTTLLGKNCISIADQANESHVAFGNLPLV
ncbi:hypothetical protein [Hydrogenophaga sp.]|uniref:hypothetical protein n=1 Tax=Hydrogenophaga sp. TaxID=1904254 RepID=UPI0035AE2781